MEVELASKHSMSEVSPGESDFVLDVHPILNHLIGHCRNNTWLEIFRPVIFIEK